MNAYDNTVHSFRNIVYNTTQFPDNFVVAQNTSGSVKIKAYDLRTLLPNKKINDEIINFYSQILCNVDKAKKLNDCQYKGSHFFNIYFFCKTSPRSIMKLKDGLEE